MKSKAQIKGHPLHPILIGFPIAFYTGTFVFDILGLTRDAILHQTAFNLNIAAICSAVLAALPGIIDYAGTVPPKSSAKKRAARHGMINTAALLLFSFVLYYRLQNESPDFRVILALEALGLVLTFIAGWMGGTLVYKNQIAVHNRYADSGKWKEEYISADNGRVEVTGLHELKTDQMKLLHVSGQRIVVARTEKGFAAFSDYCTHKGGSLAGGTMICGTVQCPWHGSQFSVTDGSVKAGPSKEPIRVYPLDQVNGKWYITVR